MSEPSPQTPTPGSTPSPTPPYPPGSGAAGEPASTLPATSGNDPEKELEAKKKALQEGTAQVAQAQKDLDALKAEVQALEAGVGDVQKLVKDYGVARPNLEKERDIIAEILVQETKEVDAVLGAIAKAVRDEVARIDGEIALLEKAVGDKDAALKAKQDAESKAKLDETAAEAAFAALKKFAADAQASITALRKIVELEGKADLENKHRKKAYLLEDLKSGLSALTLPTPDELKKILVDALNDVSAKKAASKAAKETVDAAKKEIEAAKKSAGAARASREVTIITAIEKLP